MSIANSIHGEVRFRGSKVAKVTGIDYQVQRATLENSGIGDADDEYCYGKRSTSGTATLLYKSDDPATVDIMDRIFDDGEQSDDLQMIIHRGAGKSISGPALINSLGIAVSTGENTQVSVSFVISGKSRRIF